jgi:hypothetical protein
MLPSRVAAKIVQTMDGCWLWTGALSGAGYGQLRVAGRVVYAHRFVYEQAGGVIPAGFELHHRCGARRCVCPAHLGPLSRKVHGRAHRRSVCAQGHPIEGANAKPVGRGYVQCRKCWNAAHTAWRQRRAK